MVIRLPMRCSQLGNGISTVCMVMSAASSHCQCGWPVEMNVLVLIGAPVRVAGRAPGYHHASRNVTRKSAPQVDQEQFTSYVLSLGIMCSLHLYSFLGRKMPLLWLYKPLRNKNCKFRRTERPFENVCPLGGFVHKKEGK